MTSTAGQQVIEKLFPSEIRYGISKQPADTCPIIDKAIRCIQSAQEAIRRYERSDDVDELKEMISTVEMELGEVCSYGNSGLLEDIRDNTHRIREWGKEWKELAKQHAPELDPEDYDI